MPDLDGYRRGTGGDGVVPRGNEALFRELYDENGLLTAIAADTSAIVAILRNEPEKGRFVNAILASYPRLMPAVSPREASMVTGDPLGDGAAWEPLDAPLARPDMETLPMTPPSHALRGRCSLASASSRSREAEFR